MDLTVRVRKLGTLTLAGGVGVSSEDLLAALQEQREAYYRGHHEREKRAA